MDSRRSSTASSQQGPDLKVVLLGRHNAGKTCLADRFLNEKFSAVAYQTTIGAAFGASRLDLDGHSVVMGLWDTAGSERYESLSRMFYRGAFAAVVCFDLTDPESFERMKFWVNEVRQNEEACKLFICGTKKDKIDENKSARRIDYHNALEYANEQSGQYFETSSKTGENVRSLFLAIAKEFINSPQYGARSRKGTRTVAISRKNDPSKQWSCCGK